MAHVTLDDNFPNHPKVVQAGPVAAYLYICGLCYCRRHHTNGVIPLKALPALGLTARPGRLVAALVEAGLWTKLDGDLGFQIHGYSEFYTDIDDKAAKEHGRFAPENRRKGVIERRTLKTDNGNNHAPLYIGTSERGTVLVPREEEEQNVRTQFEEFWAAYPRRDKKQVAFESWRKIRPTPEVLQSIKADVRTRAQSAQWLKDGGTFIPLPSTYLNQRRWEDGFSEPPRLSERTVNVLKGFQGPDGEMS